MRLPRSPLPAPARASPVLSDILILGSFPLKSLPPTSLCHHLLRGMLTTTGALLLRREPPGSLLAHMDLTGLCGQAKSRLQMLHEWLGGLKPAEASLRQSCSWPSLLGDQCLGERLSQVRSPCRAAFLVATGPLLAERERNL